MLKPTLYPIKFTPILKEKIWGGQKLVQHFNKKGDGNIGESWEISSVKGDFSVVKNGKLKNKTLPELIQNYKAALVGKKVYDFFGNDFPLLFKFIDAKQDLSVQLHPNDALAKKRHDSFGKTEMWYIMEAEKDARLILGFNKKMNEETYSKYLSENKITDILNSEKTKTGDAFFISTGTVHAIGAGVVLAEIQQTSDITYRIYDWNRPGIDGNLRELHTDLALQAIDYNKSTAKLNYSEKENESNLICKSNYFETNAVYITNKIERDLSKIDSFVVYMCVNGEACVEVNGFSEIIIKGETILIPAVFNTVNIKSNFAKLLEVYVP